jgi:hypothetical protein
MRFFVVILLSLFLNACSKQKKTIRKTSGNWELISYKYILPNGLTYYKEATGTLTLEKYNPTKESYGNYSFSYTINTSTQSEQGQYHYEKEATEIKIKYLTPAGVLADTLPFQTNALLSDHIILERIKDEVIYTYSFKTVND